MPTYEYRCKECGQHLEVVQSFTDDALTECASCGGPLRKLFGSIGISFKGSGFYKTDSRASSKGSTNGKDGKDGAETKDGKKDGKDAKDGKSAAESAGRDEGSKETKPAGGSGEKSGPGPGPGPGSGSGSSGSGTGSGSGSSGSGTGSKSTATTKSA